jgi:hypothetical protein
MNLKIAGLAASISLLSLLGISAAHAADVTSYSQLPAVSGVNGKVEFEGGPYGIDGYDDTWEWKGGASLSVPLGDRFGLQGDIAASNTVSGSSIEGGMLHLFTRDPSAYLIGVTGGAFWTDNANAQLIGPELELYSGPFTLQAFGGYMNTNIAGVNAGKAFGFVDATVYATENLALTVGGKDIADFKTAHAGVEWQFSDTSPISLTLDGKIGDDSYRAVDLGVKFYFGASDKSLQRRHREDDPPNRILDVFNGAGNAFTPPTTGGNPCPTPTLTGIRAAAAEEPPGCESECCD